MKKNSQEVSRELNSEKAASYVRRKQHEEELISSLLGGQPVDEDEQDTVEEEPVATVRTKPVSSTRREPVAPEPGASYIKITDKKVPVVMSCKFTGQSGRQKSFSIKLHAVSVDVSENGVSMMLANTFSIEPPVTEPMTITCGGTTYNVVYTGGVLKFDQFVNMYFTRVSTEQ